jgi:transcription termination/antitermination protein NusG
VSDDHPTPTEEDLLDAADTAALLDADAVEKIEVAAAIAEAAEEEEADAIAGGDPEAAAVIDEQADEAITELVGEAAVEAELAERILDEGSAAAGDEDTEAPQEAVADEPAPAPVEDEVVVVPEVTEVAVEQPEPALTRASTEQPEPEVTEAASTDPFRGPGDWYVVHTYAGYENKVKANLESRIHTMQMEDKIFRVHIPMEDVMEIKSGKKQVVQKKVFPGYLLVKMHYDNDSWYVVRNTPGVTGFVSAGTGSKPTPLSKREVEKILVVKKEEQKPQVRLGFEEGDVVRIISGPFADFNGTISEINPDQAKLKVLVNIFDRETPVELSFDQVAKV